MTTHLFSLLLFAPMNTKATLIIHCVAHGIVRFTVFPRSGSCHYSHYFRRSDLFIRLFSFIRVGNESVGLCRLFSPSRSSVESRCVPCVETEPNKMAAVAGRRFRIFRTGRQEPHGSICSTRTSFSGGSEPEIISGNPRGPDLHSEQVYFFGWGAERAAGSRE